jgi:hypothetical protein
MKSTVLLLKIKISVLSIELCKILRCKIKSDKHGKKIKKETQSNPEP